MQSSGKLRKLLPKITVMETRTWVFSLKNT